MAKKRPLVEDPPSASSSEEEDVSSEEESEDEQTTSQKPSAVPSPAAKKSKSKTKNLVPEADTESKKSKKKPKTDDGDGDADADADAEGGGTERKLFQRVWSEDDEVVILEGMIDYAAKHGKYPLGDMEDFHDSIKKSIHVEGFSKTQLTDKVRRLRKKYRNNAARVRYNPSKSHDQKIFLLSEKIWGEDGGGVRAPAKPRRVSTSSAGAAMVSDTLREVLSDLPEGVVNRGLDLLSEDTKADLLSKWDKIHVAEFELFSKRNRLLSEHAAFILEALKK